jgi:hypothetical protein
MEEWLITYRSYSDADLEDEIEWLRAQSRQPFEQQTEGARSWARNSAAIRDRLAAATVVLGERRNAFPSSFQADFSKVRIGSHPGSGS